MLISLLLYVFVSFVHFVTLEFGVKRCERRALLWPCVCCAGGCEVQSTHYAGWRTSSCIHTTRSYLTNRLLHN